MDVRKSSSVTRFQVELTDQELNLLGTDYDRYRETEDEDEDYVNAMNVIHRILLARESK